MSDPITCCGYLTWHEPDTENPEMPIPAGWYVSWPGPAWEDPFCPRCGTGVGAGGEKTRMCEVVTFAKPHVGPVAGHAALQYMAEEYAEVLRLQDAEDEDPEPEALPTAGDLIRAAYAAVGEQPPGPGATAADPATGLSQRDWERILPPESSAEAYARLGKCCPKCGRTDLGLQHGSHQYRIAFSCHTCTHSWMEDTLDAPVASTAGGDLPGPSAEDLRAELQAERTRADHAEQLAAQHDSQRKFAQCRADEAKGLLDALEGFHIFQKADPDDDTRTKWTSSWLVDNPLYPTLRDLANALLPAPANEEAPHEQAPE